MTRNSVGRLLLLLPLLAGAPSAGAGGCPTAHCGADDGSRFLAVRPAGQAGPLLLYELATSKLRVRLPAGLRSADGRTFVAARSAGTATVLTRYVLPSGRIAGRSIVLGRSTLAAVSAKGGRAVLVRTATRETRFTIVRTSRWTIERRVTLPGSYGVEALSPDGRRLFLVRYDRAGYNLRLYDLVTRRLRPTPLAEGPDAQSKMVGIGWTSVATRDGRWLLTLYLRKRGGGFVHVLDLSRGVGHCVEVPTGATDVVRLRASSLALSPGERTLYVASPLLGRLLVFDVRHPHIVRSVRFEVPLQPATPAVDAEGAVSPSGRRLAFAVDGRVWRYDAATGGVSAPARLGGRIAGLGFATERRLVVVRAGGAPTALDAANGRRLR